MLATQEALSTGIRWRNSQGTRPRPVSMMDSCVYALHLPENARGLGGVALAKLWAGLRVKILPILPWNLSDQQIALKG